MFTSDLCRPQLHTVPPHLVLLDARLPDLHTLCQAVSMHAVPLVVSSHQTPLEAVQAYQLAQAQSLGNAALRLRGLHLVGHGEPGRLLLGQTWLDAAYVAHTFDDWFGLTTVFEDEAQCWVYGCHTGQGEAGHAFINTLADALCLHVHAASHAVGASTQGGSWTFDRSTHPSPYAVVHNPVASAWQRSGWEYVLMADNAAPTFFSGTGKALVPVGSSNDVSESVIQQTDGKLVLAGTSRNASGNDDFSLIRLNADGSLDTGFGIGGKLLMPVGSRADDGRSVLQQPDGALVVAGSADVGLSTDFGLIRLNGADGSLDTSFDTDGKLIVPVGSGVVDQGFSVIRQPDGKLVVAGNSSNGSNNDFSLIRLNADGSLDTTFDTDGKLIVPVGSDEDRGLKVIRQTDGKLLVAGYSINGLNSDFSLIRLNANGSLDTGFGTSGKLLLPVGSGSDFAFSVIQQADGMLVVAGYGDSGSGAMFHIARLNATDGSLDTSFDTDGKLTLSVGGSSDTAFSVIQQVDGKLVMAGASSIGGNTDFAVIRLNANGSLDTSFNGTGKLTMPLGSAIDGGRSVIQQADGKLVVAGYSSNGSNTDFSLIRLNADGTLDPSFTGFATNTLGGTAAFTQGGSAVMLDAD
ncbi:MAG: hypothetical protein RLZZ612_2573, partial [Pseudomonadota bacterium]